MTTRTMLIACTTALTGCPAGEDPGDDTSGTAEPSTTDGLPTTGGPPLDAELVWELSPASGPSPRYNTRMAPIGDKLVLFGGNITDPKFLGDTWLFDGDTWTELKIPGPDPRSSYGMTDWDGAVWLYGGVGRPASGDITTYADLWKFDGAAWTRVEDNAAPGAHQSGALVAGDGGLVLTSGIDGGLSYRTDAWRYDGAWTQLADGPGMRRSMGSTSHAGRGYVLGGATPAPSPEVWSTDGATWTLEASLIHPIAYPFVCPLEDFILIFAGIQTSTTSVALAELWTPLGGAELTADPSARNHGAAARLGDRCVLFGGSSPQGNLAETWIVRVE